MSRIRRLDPSVVNKIAAGEVIERPASVIKELLENSVDALATRIDVEVRSGGTELIRVVDDGEGIPPEDLPLAVATHATSKLHAAEDLFRVQTMGFRGEALASIAEVSEFRIRSRPRGAEVGCELEVDGGLMGEPRPCGCPEGTQVEVRQLFSSTPVRRRFLKTTATEFGHVSEWFTRIALAHPRLHATLRHNDKAVFELPACDGRLERLRTFFGRELSEALIPVESEADGVRLSGYVAHPSHNRSTRKGQYFFLNGRWIQDRALQHALSEAYRGLLMVGRHPVAFLFFDVPPEVVDVNVHPTKAEVRFRDGQPLYRQLLSTLRSRFLQSDLDSAMTLGARENGNQGQAPPDPEQQRQRQGELAEWAQSQLAAWSPSDGPRESEGRMVAGSEAARIVGASAAVAVPGNEDSGVLQQSSDSAMAMPRPEARVDAGHDPSPSRAMQVLDSYLVLETDAGLTVIDQHALHERVLYEHLRERILAGTVESQQLLMPVTFEAEGKTRSVLLDGQDVLQQLGFDVEDFGGETLAITRYPVLLARADLVRTVRDLAERLEEEGGAPSRRDVLDELLHLMSCKAAVKAGDRLSSDEVESLLQQRHLVDDAHHCPHGRPTALVLSRDDLDRQFGRMG